MFGRTRLFGLLITLLFLGLILWQIDLDKLGHALAAGDYRVVLPAAGATLFGYVARTARWRRILAPTRLESIGTLFPVLMIGFMANNVLPARIGEFVRAYMLNRRIGVSKSLGLATIVLERVFDGLTLVAILLAISFVRPLPSWGGQLALMSGLIFLGAVGALALLLSQEELAQRLLRWLLRWAPAHIGDVVEEKTRSFTSGLGALRRGWMIVLIALYSVLVWAIEASSYYLLIRGFDLDLAGTPPLVAALTMLVMVNLGIMLPSAPGYVGTFQFFAILALGIFGVAREAALSVAIVSHVIQYVLVTALGMVFLARFNLSLASIRGVSTEPAP